MRQIEQEKLSCISETESDPAMPSMSFVFLLQSDTCKISDCQC